MHLQMYQQPVTYNSAGQGISSCSSRNIKSVDRATSKSLLLKSYLTFQPKGPNFLRSCITETTFNHNYTIQMM